MGKRPDLSSTLSAAVFRGYYYLKEELADFCRREGLQTSGGKIELTERIARYLDSGEKTVSQHSHVILKSVEHMTIDTVIETPFVCSEKHRAFFTEIIGKGFSFNVAFQKWLKTHAGKTYGDAVEAYYAIREEKKKGATVIDPQFEYNTYVRAFFADNPGKTLKDAIDCWKYKKSLRGHNRYEKTDLTALNQM